ncbi:MAG: PASTA domain-containing protein [Armatimonadetes bacterium]|nr:PASTA domain-containing protein [Armatimonadota bacterium]
MANGRYEAVEKLGEGAIFAAYRARDRQRNRAVTLRVVRGELQPDTAFIDALRQQCSVEQTLNHPGIIHTEEVGQHNGSTYLVSEFVRGLDLRERIRRIAPFTLSVAVEFACALGEALHYAHNSGYAHGDLRPENIIATPEGALRVANFSVYRASLASPSASEHIAAVAAPYRAPEFTPGSLPTPAGDIYAVGAIVYEMLTGAPPYAADSTEAMAAMHAGANIPRLRAANPGVPRAVEGIVTKCLQKDFTRRYASAAELLADLKMVRDALRFGKSLSWSPLELPPTVPPGSAAAVPTEPAARTERASPPPPSRSAAARTTMKKQSRFGLLVSALQITLLVAIVLGGLGVVGIWFYKWGIPKDVGVPDVVGTPIDQAAATLQRLGLKVIEHPEYSNQPKNLVYKVDEPPGTQLKTEHAINVWYSKGPMYITAPSVLNMDQQDALQAVKDAGLTLGAITTADSDTAPPGTVVSQSVSPGRKVFHDSPISLVVSDGPSAGSSSSASGNAPASGAGDQADAGGGNSAVPPTPPDSVANGAQPDDLTVPHTFDRTVDIPMDGRGTRTVRITYSDAVTPTPVELINEPHTEGDKIHLNFPYYGRKVTLSIYYDGRRVWRKRFDPKATDNQIVK